MRLRKFRRGDEKQIQQLHYGTVHSICAEDYSQEQLNSWSPKKVDVNRWAESLEKNISYVIEDNGELVGFGDISTTGHLYRLYTHKNYQGKGIGSKILQALEEEAKKLGLDKIKLDSTITAKTFYEIQGFKCIGKSTIEFRGVEHEDYLMEKEL